MTGHRAPFDVRGLFGVPIAAVTMAEVLSIVDDAISRRKPLQIGVVNAAKPVNMGRDDELRQSVLSSDIILADGMAVVWASRLLRRPLPERVAGIDLMMAMLARGNERRYAVYCLGATAEVSREVAARIRAGYPGVRLVGWHDGYFRDGEEAAIADEIARLEPDILLVAMTSPKKEHFLARWSGKIKVPVCHGVGGSFDVMAGMVQRAPERWQRLGLEWLYRVKQEPRRLWKRYLVTNVLFCRMIANELFGQSLRRGHRTLR
jgi:N-acetylglucosaminyldiphosphoundecaprenol N-acetyl-beta-D-mannosaminyltransferase